MNIIHHLKWQKYLSDFSENQICILIYCFILLPDESGQMSELPDFFRSNFEQVRTEITAFPFLKAQWRTIPNKEAVESVNFVVEQW